MFTIWSNNFFVVLHCYFHSFNLEKHQKLRQFKAEIKDDPIRYKELQIKASYYFLTVDEMLQIEAEKMLDKNE